MGHPVANVDEPLPQDVSRMLVTQAWLLRDLLHRVTLDTDPWSSMEHEALRALDIASGLHAILLREAPNQIPTTEMSVCRNMLTAVVAQLRASSDLASLTDRYVVKDGRESKAGRRAAELRESERKHASGTLKTAHGAAHRALTALVEAWPNAYRKHE